MKKLICFLLLIPLFAFSQTNDIDVTIVKEKSTIGKVKDVAITTASVMSATTLFKVAKNAASQVYLDRSEAILVPLNVELGDYTTLALVDCFMGTKRKAKYFELDISENSSYENLKNILLGSDGVFHLAALPRVQESIDNPLHFEKNNTLSTINILKACADSNVKRLVYSASSSAYGNGKT